MLSTSASLLRMRPFFFFHSGRDGSARKKKKKKTHSPSLYGKVGFPVLSNALGVRSYAQSQDLDRLEINIDCTRRRVFARKKAQDLHWSVH